MSDTEKEVMAMYRESAPDENKLFWRSHVNHVAWSLLLIVIAFSVWLMIALANAENQRNAYASSSAADTSEARDASINIGMFIESVPFAFIATRPHSTAWHRGRHMPEVRGHDFRHFEAQTRSTQMNITRDTPLRVTSRYPAGALIASATLALLELAPPWAAGPGRAELHNAVGQLARHLASLFTPAPSLVRAGSDRASMAYELFIAGEALLMAAFICLLWLRIRPAPKPGPAGGRVRPPAALLNALPTNPLLAMRPVAVSLLTIQLLIAVTRAAQLDSHRRNRARPHGQRP
eukprot:gene29405-33206_t